MTIVSKMILIPFTLVLLAPHCSAFTALSTGKTTSWKLHAYVPTGLTAKEYQKIKQKDAEKTKGKNLGKLGPQGFKSRSIQAWQEAFERGEAGHTFSLPGYFEKLKQGLVRKEDVPYMQRGGSWDNSDVLGSKKKPKWSETDRKYAKGGYKKEQSSSILGSGPGFDWTGRRRNEKGSKRSYPGLF